MSHLTKKEFGKLVSMATNHLATYVKRGKVVLLTSGLIDSLDPRNEAFIKKCNSKNNNHSLKEIIKVEKIIKVKEPITINPTDPQQSTKQAEPTSNLDKYTLEVEKLEKGNKKLDVETRLAELKEEKIRGEVIPVVLVTSIFKAHSQAIVTSQKDFIEFLLIQVSKEARLTGDQLAKLRGKMVVGLNEAVDKSIVSSKKNLKSLINEYSIARGVGEHE